MPDFNRDALHQQLVTHEGLRLRPYQDTQSVWTLGVGHNLSVPISHDAALRILDDDINEILRQLAVTVPFLSKLNDGRQRAVIDLAFQYGVFGMKMHFADVLYELERACWECAAKRLEQSPYAQIYHTRAADIIALIRQG